MLTENQIIEAIKAQNSDNPFVINFDLVWEELGYSTKGNAKYRVVNQLVKDTDYKVFMNIHKNPMGGRPSETIMLTVDGFKHFCLMANTSKGREIRQYFIECEKAYRENLNRSLHIDTVELKPFTFDLPEDFYDASFYDKTLMLKRLSEAYLRASKISPNPVIDGMFQVVLLQMFESLGITPDMIPQTHIDISKALERVDNRVKGLPPELKQNIDYEQSVLRGMAMEHPEKYIYFSDLRKVKPFSNKFIWPTKKLNGFLYNCIARDLLIDVYGNLTVLRWIGK